MVPALPAAKLGSLLIRQISKPIASLIKDRAKSHPFFRRYVCLPPALFYNWCEVKTKMLILNFGKPVSIPVLSEQQAIELGASLLGEGIIFLIAAALLLAEYSRQVKKEAVKEQIKKDEMERFIVKINELAFRIEKHDTQLREALRKLMDLETRVVVKPWKKSITDDDVPNDVIHDDKIRIEKLANDKLLHVNDDNLYTLVNRNSLVLKAIEFVECDLLSDSYQVQEDNFFIKPIQRDDTEDDVLARGFTYLSKNSLFLRR